MALNKETVYTETKKVRENIANMDNIIDNLLLNHDSMACNTEEARHIFQQIETDSKP